MDGWPVRIEEQRARGISLDLQTYELKMIDYSAQTGQPFETGISLRDGQRVSLLSSSPEGFVPSPRIFPRVHTLS
jgi:hypothetical protein